MKKCVLILAILLLPTIVSAQSWSIADLFYPSYGSASYYLGSNEHFGAADGVEDGISWTSLTAGEITTFSVAVSVGDDYGVGDYYNLAIWADWDGNRTFNCDEQIINIVDNYFDAGITLISFNVLIPETAISDDLTWLRARFEFNDFSGPLAPAGFGLFGEVEDYAINIAPVPEPATIILLGIGLAGTAIASRRKKK